MKFNIPQNFRLSTLLYNKKFTVALSLVLAFILWLSIAMTENPVRERTFDDIKANISLKGTAAEALGLDIISDHSDERFSITVSGPNYIVSSLKADDFSLTAFPTKISTAGEYELELVAQSTNNKSGYTITSISPSTISVSVDFIESKEFVVTPKVIGVSASEGLILDKPIFADTQQSTITIKGPRSKIEKISSVVALAEDDDVVLSENKPYTADIVLYDKDNKIIYRYTSDGTVFDANGNTLSKTSLTPSFKTATITQVISKQKVVPCIPDFVNLPSGISISDLNYTLNFDEVTIKGSPEEIDKIDKIVLNPIDFRDVTISENSFEVSVATPLPGIEIREDAEFFIVDINLTGYAERNISVNEFRFTGNSNNFTPHTEKSIRVKICGPERVIDDVTAEDLYLLLDLTDKNSGICTVEATVKSDVYNNIWQIGTYETIVELKNNN